MVMQPSNLSLNLSYLVKLWKAATPCLMVMQPLNLSLNLSLILSYFVKTLEGCYSMSNGQAAFILASLCFLRAFFTMTLASD